MPRALPRVTAREIISVLEKRGFKLSRQSGNSLGKRLTVPFHGSKSLHPKVLKNILKDADIDIKQLKELL